MKYLKFGFGRATDVANNYIRRNLLSRNDAIKIVSENDGLYPSSYLDKSLEEILDYFEITIDEFNQVCDDYTNYELFELDNNDELIRRADGSPKLKNSFNCFQIQ